MGTDPLGGGLLLRWWRRLPSWAAVIIGLFTVGAVFALLTVGLWAVIVWIFSAAWEAWR